MTDSLQNKIDGAELSIHILRSYCINSVYDYVHSLDDQILDQIDQLLYGMMILSDALNTLRSEQEEEEEG